MAIVAAQRPRLIWLISEGWFFTMHFLPLARAARAAGFEVAVATRAGDQQERLAAEGVRVIPLVVDRQSMTPLGLASAVLRLRGILTQERPSLVHVLSLKFIMLAGLAAQTTPRLPLVLSPTGLGHLWINSGPSIALARWAVQGWAGLLARQKRCWWTFENAEDRADLGLHGRQTERTLIIGGWGMETPRGVSPPLLREPGDMRLCYIGRMLHSKGIAETVEAVCLARAAGARLTLDLWGLPDPANPASLTEAELQAYATRPGIRWHGQTNNPADAWSEADAAILLSKREGLPRALIEAAAAGLPLVATDVPGCRAIVQHNSNGFLVPPGDIATTAQVLTRLAADPPLRQRLGQTARADFAERFTIESVVPRVLGLYKTLAEMPVAEV